MNGKTVIVERLDKDHDGFVKRKTLMRIEPRFLKVFRYKNSRVFETRLTDDGIEFYNGKTKDWNPNDIGYYHFHILSREEINERIKKLEKNIKNEKDTIVLLKHADNINL